MKNYYVVFAVYRGMIIEAENEDEVQAVAGKRFLEKDESITMVREVPKNVGSDYKVSEEDRNMYKVKNDDEEEIEVDYEVVK